MNYNTIIIGAGAAGMMCAIEAAKRGRNVLLLEKSNKLGRKILMSGGGRCNFTNLNIHPEKYISQNPHFVKSALARYTQWDFIHLIKKHQIPFHEKTLGQLFCDHKAHDIVDMLSKEMMRYNVTIQLNSDDIQIKKIPRGFSLGIHHQSITTENLVIATGGLSIPSMGSSPFAYQIAKQFGLHVVETRAGLVPITLHEKDKKQLSPLAGISINVIASTDQNAISFRENMLFTHRGLSGPAILQISSYWESKKNIYLNLLPDINIFEYLKNQQRQSPKVLLKTVLTSLLPARFVDIYINENLLHSRLADINHATLATLAEKCQRWMIKPNGTEGYRTAEVTLGGINTDELSSKTMEAKKIAGLFFIGEAVDVTGWLGGYNFQWAWSSGWAAGQVC